MMVRGAEAPFELGGALVRMVAFIHDTLAPLPSLQTTSTAGLDAANGNWAIGPSSSHAPGTTMGMWRSRTWDAPATVLQSVTARSLTVQGSNSLQSGS